MWLQSEGVIIMGAIFLALVIGYYKWKESSMAYKKKNGKGGKKK